MFAIYKKELIYYYKSLLGYVYMGFVLMVFGILFTMSLLTLNGDYSQIIGSHVNIMFVLILGSPLITMHLLSEERNQKTDQLLMSSPIYIKTAVIAKYLSALTVFVITIAITLLQPIILSFLGNIPLAKIIGTYIGFILLGSSLIAIGLFISTIAHNQVTAAVVSYICFLGIFFSDTLIMTLPKSRFSSIVFVYLLVSILILILYSMIKNWKISFVIGILFYLGTSFVVYNNPSSFDGFTYRFIEWFSIMRPFNNLSSGILPISSLIYYLSIIIIFVYLSMQIIERRRWN